LTRTFWFGNDVDDQFTELYSLVARALESAARQIRPGIRSEQAHEFAMSVIDAGGYRDYFPHGLGHGVGLDIHEQPFLADRPPYREVEQGMVLTIEPGIYLPGWGGIRLEDLVLVTSSGLETISQSPKTPQIRP
jgi:Xaa-Pro aminopeptidase